ncbi:MAG: Tab2/Atab2 family RNA-binding protein [Leptolyngbyaceae cyanobacterium]
MQDCWEIDCYRRPLADHNHSPLWELVVCTSQGELLLTCTCPQAAVSADWVVAQLTPLLAAATRPPAAFCLFRPQALALIEAAGQLLGIPVIPTRRTPGLKRCLQERATVYPTLPAYTGQAYQPIALDRPPPTPLPEKLWGDRWRFATIGAANLLDAVVDRPIPILEIPPELDPVKLGLASTTAIPGVVIDGGRQSMVLARWLHQTQPVSLHFIGGDPDGLVLEAGLVDRWILTTSNDPEVAIAGRQFETRKQGSQGLHFLLVQPDDTGITYTGFWLLLAE